MPTSETYPLPSAARTCAVHAPDWSPAQPPRRRLQDDKELDPRTKEAGTSLFSFLAVPCEKNYVGFWEPVRGYVLVVSEILGAHYHLIWGARGTRIANSPREFVCPHSEISSLSGAAMRSCTHGEGKRHYKWRQSADQEVI